MQYTKPIDPQQQAMYRAFGINPNRRGNNRRGHTNGPGHRTTSQGGNAMDINAAKTGRVLRAKDPKVRRARVCIMAAGLVHLGIAGSEHWP